MSGSGFPRITLVTPSYNQAQFLEATLESVFSQAYPNLEYIVMDGGSSDGSVDIIRRYEKNLAYWQSKPDGGQSNAINLGFKRATGDILGWLNSDDVLKPGALLEVARRFKDVTQPQWLIGSCEISDASGQPYLSRLPPQGLQRCLCYWYEGWFTQQATFWTRAMWRRVGPVRTDLEFAMDYDLWLRMGKVSEPLIVHRNLAGYRQHGEAKCHVHWVEAIVETRKVALDHIPRYLGRGVELKRWRLKMAQEHLFQARAACNVPDFEMAFKWLKLAVRMCPGILASKNTREFSFKLWMRYLSLEKAPENPRNAALSNADNTEALLKRSAFVLPDELTLSGVNSWLLALSQVLSRQGASPTFLEHRESGTGASRKWLPADSIHIECAGMKTGWPNYAGLDAYLPFYRQLKSHTVIPNWSHATYAACARLRMEDPNAVRVLGYAHSDEWCYYHWLSYYEQTIDRFVAVSEEVGQKLRNRLPPYRHQDIVVKPYGVMVPDQFPARAANADGSLRLTYAGRIQEWQKRTSDLIVLAEHLSRQGVDYSLRLAGEGEGRKDLEDRLQQCDADVRRRVQFLGRIPYSGMTALWRSSDLCVLTSEFEGTSLSMLEAMAQGCVPIVTRVSGVGAAIEEGISGYSVKVGDMVAMAERVHSLAADRAKLAAMGRAAYERVKARYSMEEYACWFSRLSEEVWRHSPQKWPRSKKVFLPMYPQTTWYTDLANHRFGVRTRLKRLIPGLG